MHRMTGLDANFLYAENSRLFSHTLKIVELDVARIDYSFDRFKRALQALLPRLPPFCQRIVEVPLRLDHPVWICDRMPDLDHHVRHHVLPPPGDAAQFDDLIAHIASSPLARNRPLWEVHVVEGLRNGNIGVVAKLHHAMADGVAAAHLLERVTTAEPDTEPSEPIPSLQLETPPTRMRLFADAFLHRLLRLRTAPKLVFATLRAIGRWRRARASAPEAPPLPYSAPNTCFNGRLSRRRRFTRTSLDLEAVKRVKNTFDCSVNDVILALVAGSLRRYLTRHRQSLAQPLLAAMPVGTSSDDYLEGNRVSNTFVCLATHIEDPIERLHAIHEIAAISKRLHRSFGVDMLARWSELSRRWATHWWWQRGARWLPRPAINLVVSNVRGPQAPRYAGGAELAELYSVGPVLERVGLNVTVWSYLDRLNVSILSCAQNLPDPWEVADGLGRALTELLDACERGEAADSPPRALG